MTAEQPSARFDVVAVAAGAVAAAACAVVLGSLGSTGLVAGVGLAAAAGGGVVMARRLPGLLPAVAAAPRPALPDRRRRGSRAVETTGLCLAAGVAGLVAVVGGALGLKGAALLLLLALGVGAAVVARRQLAVLLLGRPATGRSVTWSAPGLLRVPRLPTLGRRPSRPLRLVAGLLLVGTAAVVAWLAAALGLKGVVLLVGGALLAGVLLLARDREALLLFGLPTSLALFLHKSIGPEHLVNSGAPAFYVTSLDVLLVLLYVLWWREGTLVADLRSGLRRPALWVPAVASLTLLPSLTAGASMGLALPELLRTAWMYLLYAHLALRVRRAAQVWTVLAGLAVVAAVELVVVVLQWRTGGVLGLGFLGVPQELGERVTDAGDIGRPFGTIVHPVFLGAVMASLTLLALSLGMSLRRGAAKSLCLAAAPVCLVPLLLSSARAAALALGVVALLLLLVGLARGQVPARVLLAGGALALTAAVVFLPQITSVIQEQFESDHVSLEVESRVQLNQLARAMFADHALVGVGLNNFQHVMGRYDDYGLLFQGNPVHNLFLLQAAETGLVGLAGLLAVGGVLLAVSLRTARSGDPLSAGLGTAMAAVLVFFLGEEMLGFSLRQEVPLALFWILAGLTVARSPAGPPAATRPVRTGRPTAGRHRRPRRRLPRVPAQRSGSLALAVAVLAALVLPGMQTGSARAAGAGPLAGLRIVMAAVDRRSGVEEPQSLWTVLPDGSDLRRASPPDGRYYDFPQWVLGGSKLVYSVRGALPGSPENIEMSDPDGSHQQALTTSPWRNDQPKVSPDGRTLVFSGFVPGTPLVALYAMDLQTLLVRNLTAVHGATLMADADPRWSVDGSQIVFARGRSDQGPAKTQVYVMTADGTGRRQLTSDDAYDVDPALSPDGRAVSYSSYTGPGTPQQEGLPTQAKHQDFHIVVRDLGSGQERTLTAGASCVDRPPGDSCSPTEGSAYVPLWTPDGSTLGYVMPLDQLHVCICAMTAAGGAARVLVAVPGLSPTTFDWIRPGSPPPGAVREPGRSAPTDRLLVSGTQTLPDGTTAPVLLTATRDMWNRSISTVTGGRSVRFARWNSARTSVVFSSVGAVSTGPAPTPAGPRSEHFTLQDLALPPVDPVQRPAVSAEQVYVVGPGGVRALSNPWLEDPHDGLKEGDRRGSTEPDLSPDGTQVVFTNVSALDGESFLLREDLATGQVFNLTNATAGAVPVADSQPRWSPDGRTIAFRSDFEGASGIYVMDAATGTDVRRVVADDAVNVDPEWSPDGRSLVYASYRGGTDLLLHSLLLGEQAGSLPLAGWSLVVADVATGVQRVVTRPEDSPAFAPAWSPDGSQIAFITVTAGQPDVAVVDAAGGPARPLQITGGLQELSVDWR